MPVLDGIETLKEIKARGLKTKVILFSSVSPSGAEKTLQALQLGAIDFVAKPQPDETHLSPAEKIKDALLPKILTLFGLAAQRRPAKDAILISKCPVACPKNARKNTSQSRPKVDKYATAF